MTQRLRRPEMAALATGTAFVVATLWMMFRGRPVGVAAVASLTLLAVIIIPLCLLMAIVNRWRGDRRRGRDSEEDTAPGADDSRSHGSWVPSRTFAKAESALNRGELWRAKEILQGTLASQQYHPELYERYGRVLLEMGDLLSAGKYLFLSGSRDAAYEAPIAIFLNRFRGRDAGELVRVLPSRARDVDRLPPAVVEVLAQMGWRPHDLKQAGRGYQGSSATDGSWLDHAAVTLSLLIFVVVLGLGIVAFFDLLGEMGGYRQQE
ncbi:MAG: hypothetical protein HKN72_11610 [Gemmatimonadetes bacterium]|nr:hypothetical protein [Gemmatimonadota bacterium]NNF13865.1 hypothetical protein [Gemmatimonadota bacterium]